MNYFICENCNGTAYVQDKDDKQIYHCTRCKTNYHICMNCEGTGYVLLETGIFDCPKCNGSGLLKNKVSK